MNAEMEYIREVAADQKVNGDDFARKQAKWLLSLPEDRLEAIAVYMEGHTDMALDELRETHKEEIKRIQIENSFNRLRLALKVRRECAEGYDVEFNAMLAECEKETRS